jgi:Flp pilus assembly protein TadG
MDSIHFHKEGQLQLNSTKIGRLRTTRSQRGAALPLMIASIVGLCGMTALAVDVGMMYFARQRAQNMVDAAAISGSQLLPATTTGAQNDVTAHINSVINASNVSGNPLVHVSVTYPTTVTKDDGSTVTVPAGYAVKVDGYVDAKMTFAPIVGFHPSSLDGTQNTKSVPAHSTCATFNGGPALVPAARSTGGSGSDEGISSTPAMGVVPLSVIGDDEDSDSVYVATMSSYMSNATHPNTPKAGTYQAGGSTMEDGGHLFLLKDGSSGGTGSSKGNFSALSIGGNGASTYEDGLAYGSTVAVRIGDILSTKPGNMVGPTRKGIDDRLSSSNSSFTHYFDDYNEWFFGRSTYAVDSTMGTVTDPVTGVAHSYYKDPQRQNKTDAHILIVPVITTPGKNGRADVTVLGFGVFFLESEMIGSGKSSQITGRFIGMAIPGAEYTNSPTAGAITPPKIL